MFCSLNLVDRLVSSDKVLVLVRVSKGKDCLIAKLPIQADEKVTCQMMFIIMYVQKYILL